MNAVTQLKPEQKPKTLGEYLAENKEKIMQALPKHLTAERLLRLAVNEVRNNDDLRKCDQLSLFGAIVRSAQLGLEIGSDRGLAYLVPFNKNLKNEKGLTIGTSKEAQFIIGYRGYIALLWNAGWTCHAFCVYEKDVFHYQAGTNTNIKHIPNLDEKSALKCTYVIFKHPNHPPIHFVCPMWMIQEAKSRAKTQKIWNTDFEAMALKTGIRRGAKFVPSDTQLQQAIIFDEAAERDEQDNTRVFDVEAERSEKPRADQTRTEKAANLLTQGDKNVNSNEKN